MKKVGILTMHRVINYGSALQAYATMKTIANLGYDAELIDYIFPNKKIRQNVLIRIKKILAKIMILLFYGDKKKRFEKFYSKYYKCSEQYNSPYELNSANFAYDILLTGSDQVWNPIHTGDDFSFLLSFANDETPRISYASSFSTSILPDRYKTIYADYLRKYKYISVRELSGVNIVNELIGKRPYCTCDPTLLLSKTEWSDLANEGRRLVKGRYILLYILTYAYNPYPEILNAINYVKVKMNLPIVTLNGSLFTNRIEGAKIIKNAGPLEFLRLIRDASFVITTSFHGTAFSLNFEKAFFSIINNSKKDTRMIDLLTSVGAEDRALMYNSDTFNTALEMDYSSITPRLVEIRNSSLKYLKKSLINSDEVC